MTPRIAIVGTGLAGALLADALSGSFDVTAFERGRVVPTLPPRPRIAGHPLGLYPSFAYGLGGTTNYWAGGMMRMSRGEYAGHWPDGLYPDLEAHMPDVLRRLYGQETATWMSEQRVPADADLFLDRLWRPRTPFRAARSSLFSRARLNFDSEVVRIAETPDGVVVTSVANDVVRDDGFDLVVVAAGGMNSPVILARSGLGGDAVGLNITDHPMGFIAKITKKASNRFDEMALRSKDPQQYEPTLKVRDPASGLWSAFYLRPTSTDRIQSDPYADSFDMFAPRAGLLAKATAVVTNADLRAQALNLYFGRPISGDHAYVLVAAEQEATGQGCVDQDDSGSTAVSWTISDQVVDSVRRSLATFEDWVGGTVTLAEGDLRKRMWTAAHHSGGCRISIDPTAGVVDSDLRVHGTSSVYVCDGSVLPSTGASNTGLTIGALALRLAASLIRTRRRVEATPPPRTNELLVTGASSHVAQMVLPYLSRLGLGHTSLDLRRSDPPDVDRGARVVLHLANDSSSPEANVVLQQRVASLMERGGLTEVIVTMTFATLQSVAPGRAGLDQANCGFDVPYMDPYIRGKLDAEEFWTQWQRQAAGRVVTFLYIPTILGPHSEWTRNIAAARIGTAIWVPDIVRFFTLSEAYLARTIAALSESRPPPGVHRQVAYETCDRLATAIASDRGARFVRPVRLSAPGWKIVSLAGHRLMGKVLSRAMNVGNKVTHRLLKRSLLPVGPFYYALFHAQDVSAAEIERLAR